MITKTFEARDQLDKEGKVIDKLFTITESKTIEEKETISGTELAFKISQLENEMKWTEWNQSLPLCMYWLWEGEPYPADQWRSMEEHKKQQKVTNE